MYYSYLIWIPLLLTGSSLLPTCNAHPEAVAPHPPLPTELATSTLKDYREKSLSVRRFKHADLLPLLLDLPTDTFVFDTAGYSVEKRALWRVTYGNGPVTVLLWSQMHGDEPTATAAIFDLFNWLRGRDDGMDSLRQAIQKNLQLTFLPMLNPDGAQVYERRNAQGIDLNRDALDLSSPEARVLKDERDRLAADWGFNLHDQSLYYSAGFPAERGCVLSVLAPAYDWDKSMNEKREAAARVIALMDAQWQTEIPGRVGRYSDDFEPRAFGDNFQRWGTRTILVESGGYAGDPEKQVIRRLNLLGMIAGLYGIATNGYRTYSVQDYRAIPENRANGMHALILENVALERAGQTYRVDIGFRQDERTLGPDYRQYTTSAYVSDLGDLRPFGAFERVDLTGKRIVLGKVYPDQLSSAQLSGLDHRELYQREYTAVQLTSPPPYPIKQMNSLRLLYRNGSLDTRIAVGGRIDLLVYNGDTSEAVVANGHYLNTNQENYE